MVRIENVTPNEAEGGHARKHGREIDDGDFEEEFDKRLKLDLGSEMETEQPSASGTHSAKITSGGSKYSINPHAKVKYSITKPSILKDGSSSSSSIINSIGGITSVGGGGANSSSAAVDTFLAKKLFMHFHNIYASKAAIILWYSSHWVVIYHFQRWALRLFNRFYRKYHKRIGTALNTVKAYKNFGSIMELVSSAYSNLSWEDLMRILTEENYLERRRLHKREISRRQREKQQQADEEMDAFLLEHDAIAYNYWDRLRGLDKDVNMFDAVVEEEHGGAGAAKFEELNDSDMEIE